MGSWCYAQDKLVQIGLETGVGFRYGNIIFQVAGIGLISPRQTERLAAVFRRGNGIYIESGNRASGIALIGYQIAVENFFDRY